MGNVKWHACFVALLWNVLKADWSMLICVKHGNQLVEVVSIMWIKFKWEPSGAEMPEELFFFFVETRDDEVEHNAAAITIHLLIPSWKQQGENPTCSSPWGIEIISRHISLVPSGLSCQPAIRFGVGRFGGNPRIVQTMTIGLRKQLFDWLKEGRRWFASLHTLQSGRHPCVQGNYKDIIHKMRGGKILYIESIIVQK